MTTATPPARWTWWTTLRVAHNPTGLHNSGQLMRYLLRTKQRARYRPSTGGRCAGLATAGAEGQSRSMIARTAFVILIFLAGCATSSPEPDPGATSAAGPAPELASSPGTAPRRAPAARPSDWAFAVVGTPFVFGFRAVVCAASAVVAGPAAALFAVSDDPRGGFAYLRHGLAQNCGPPYAVPLPSVTDRAREATARYAPAPPVVRSAPGPDLGPPRPLTPYTSAAVMSP